MEIHTIPILYQDIFGFQLKDRRHNDCLKEGISYFGNWILFNLSNDQFFLNRPKNSRKFPLNQDFSLCENVMLKHKFFSGNNNLTILSLNTFNLLI